jgi:hypothetical protein
MKFIRFVLPFLFVRNWVDGSWEFSRARFIIFGAIALLSIVALSIAYMLQAPVVYINSEV